MPLIGMEKNIENQVPIKIGTIVNKTTQNFALVSSQGQIIGDLPAGATLKFDKVIQPLLNPVSIKTTQNFVLFIVPSQDKQTIITTLQNASNDIEKRNRLLNVMTPILEASNSGYLHYQVVKELPNKINLNVGFVSNVDFTYSLKPEYIQVKRTFSTQSFTAPRPLTLNLTLKNLSKSSLISQVQVSPEINNIKLYKTIDQKDFQAVRQQIPTLNLNMIDERGNNPLHHAVKYGSPEIINLLLQAAPQLAALKNYQGQTPVDLAAGNFDILKLFVPQKPNQCPQ